MQAVAGIPDAGRGLYAPPRPVARPALLALLRVALRGDGDLLSLLPANAYRMEIGPLGYSRRSILIVNRPDQVSCLIQKASFPKAISWSQRWRR